MTTDTIDSLQHRIRQLEAELAQVRVQADALPEVQDHLRRAQEAGGVGVFSVRLADDILLPTPEFCRLFGLPVADTYPAGIVEDLVVVDDSTLVSNRASRERDDVIREVEYRIIRPDTEEVRWIFRRGDIERDERGRPVRFVGVARDVTDKHVAQREIAQREERYRSLFDSLDEGFCIIEFFDGPHGPLSDYIHIEANAAYAVHAGIENVVGQKLREMVPDEADGWVERYGGVLRTGQPIRFQQELVRTGRHLELAAFRIEPPSLKQVAVLFTDVTPRRTAELALKESEAQFRAFAQAIPNHVWAARPDGSLSWLNRQALDYLGQRTADLTGTDPWQHLAHPEDLESARSAWARTLATGHVFETELRIRRHDGSYRWFLARAEPVRDDAGLITRWVGTNTDIDHRRRAALDLAAMLEEQVRQSTRERDRLWDTTNDLMGSGGYDGFLKSVNPAWEQVLGWTQSELLDRPFATIVDTADHAEVEEVVRQLRAGKTVTGFVDRVLTKAGGVRTIMWTAVPDETTDRFHIVGRDLTEQRAMEEALRQSQKMEAVGQLTGGLAHDFNNLLAGISGSLELLQTRIRQGRLPEVDRYIVAAQGASRRAAALTQRLLAFSRRQTLDPKPTDTNRLVAGMEELVRRTVGPEVAVEVVTSAGLWSVFVDPPQLENSLLNLCINARDAMPTGGRITIETANRWLDERAARDRDLPPGQYVSLCVTDTGSGMTADVVARAFDPFFTTKPLGQGTGLGLSMVYGFVRQSGGQVRIYSEPEQGTTMCLYLPRHYGDAAGPEVQSAETDLEKVGTNEVVLVVDDEPTVRMLVMEVLGELGFDGLEAVDGAGGLKVLQTDTRIDLLITDVGLPGGMNGRQLADAARVLRPDLKVLFITGYAENAIMGNGNLDPGMQVLTKPFVLDALGSRIRSMLRRDG